jgi:hypothetical protein
MRAIGRDWARLRNSVFCRARIFFPVLLDKMTCTDGSHTDRHFTSARHADLPRGARHQDQRERT